MRRNRAAVLVLGGATLAGCSLVGRSLDDFFAESCESPPCGTAGSASGGSGGTAGSGSGGTGNGGSAADGGGGATCDLRKAPPRPDIPDDGDISLTFGLRDILVDQGNDWKTIGLDLDDRCSYGANPDVECQPVEGVEKSELDGEDGLDNSFGHNLYPLLKAGDPEFENEINDAINNGVTTPVIHIEGFNGNANDPSVKVWFAQARYALRDGAPDSGLDGAFMGGADAAPPPEGPAWDGNDRFFLQDNNFGGGNIDLPLIGNDNAYVAEGKLVFRVPDRVTMYLPVVNRWVDNGRIPMRFTDVLIVGKLVNGGKGFKDVQLTARWSLGDALDGVEFSGICPGDGTFTLLENAARPSLDIRSIPGTGGPNAVCDAVSVGIVYQAGPIKIGGIVPAEVRENPCNNRTDGGVEGGDGGGAGGSSSGGSSSGGSSSGGSSSGGSSSGGGSSGGTSGAASNGAK